MYNSRLFKIGLAGGAGFRIWAAALLSMLGAVQVTSVLNESATFDEGAYVAAGYSYLKTGDFRMNPEHPPLAKVLSALPLLFYQPDLPLGHPSWAGGYLVDFAEVFLYKNRIPADSLLFAARSVTIAFTLLFGMVVGLWTRRHFGAPAALLALFLFATDPNIIAHGRYTTNDLLTALFFFLAVTAWTEYLLRRRGRDLVWSGLALGLALLTKFSALLLVFIYIALYLCRAWQEEDRGSPPPVFPTRLSVERFFISMLVVAVISVALILPAYAFKSSLCEKVGLPIPPGIRCCLSDVADPQKSPSGHFLATLARAFHLPDHPYLVGLFTQFQHNEIGHSSYLLGQQSQWGWWYYYPVAFLVKTPTAVLALAAFGLAIGVGTLSRFRLAGLRALPFPWIALVAPILIYFASAMTSQVDLGVRYLLPIYPFLMMLLAAGFLRLRASRFRRAFPYLLALVLVVQTAESAAIYPDYLAFFNTVSGGPANGVRYLLDSNIDWGQDLKRLKHYLDANQVQSVCLNYFGSAPPVYYGITSVPLPWTESIAERKELDCVAAVSVTVLHDLYLPTGSYAWVRQLKPVARIGRSIYVYDLRQGRRREGASNEVDKAEGPRSGRSR